MNETNLQETVVKLEIKLRMMREELQQYLRDLRMWQTAHGVEYPLRRIKEVMAKMEDIEKV